MKGRRIDICQSCSEEAEMAAHGLCYSCYRKVERQAAYDKSGWNPGDTRKQKRLARAHGKLIEALLDFGAGTHPNAERLVGILAAELLPLAEFLGTDVNSEQQVGVHVHTAPVPLGVEVAQADSEQFGDVHGHSGVSEPEAEGVGDDDDPRLNEEGCSRSQELPGVIKDPVEAGRRNDADQEAGHGVASGYAGDDAVDYGAFKPAVAVGDGDGCEPQQEDVPGCNVPVPGEEAHGTDSIEVTQTADAGSPPCAMPGHRRGAKLPPVAIVLEDGRYGHVIAGMGERTKRTMYGVRLENGERAEVRKKHYATPANLAGLCLVPKSWLVDGGLPHDKVPEFLKGQAPVQESGSGEY